MQPKSPRKLRLWVLFAVLVLLMQFSDPLGEVALGDAILFWSGRLAGVAAALVLAEWLLARFCATRWNSPPWLKPALLAMIVAAAPMTLVEITLETAVPQSAPFDDSALREWSPVLAFVSEYLTILSVILPVNVVLWVIIDMRGGAAADSVDPVPAFAQPAFLTKTDGIALENVLALAAEEHYVRVVTSDRSELVYGRFRDVVAEMPESAGLQVHRSWWVAENAVVAARRGARRYELELLNGATVPVSDRFTQRVRERGLLTRPRARQSRDLPG